MAGLTALMNPDRVHRGDLGAAEAKVMYGGGPPPAPEPDPDDTYIQELAQLERSMGLELREDEGIGVRADTGAGPRPLFADSDSGSDADAGSQPSRSGRSGRSASPAASVAPRAPPRPRPAASRQDQRRGHITAVMQDMRAETRTFQGESRARVQDRKVRMIEQIALLRMNLEEDGISCESVEHPGTEWELQDIQSVLGILRAKNDRNRYASLAEEIILGLAEGIEAVFDGSRSVLGWQPDYRGYPNTVNAKLHRMRFETSQVVGDVLETANIGPKARIFLELLPSLVLYPRQRRKMRAAPGLKNDPALRRRAQQQALSDIRQRDEIADLGDI